MISIATITVRIVFVVVFDNPEKDYSRKFMGVLNFSKL